MAEPTLPTTQKGQIEALYTSLGVSDFPSAIETIPALIADKKKWADWEVQRQDLFTAFGGSGNVPEHYDFSTAVDAMKADQRTIFEKLGVNDWQGALLAVDNLRTQNNNLQAVQTSIFGALKSNDHAGAMRAITDIDGRVEAGIQVGLIARAASAGLTEPIAKPTGEKTLGANTITVAEFDTMSPKQQLEFSKAGGKLVDEHAAV